MPLNYRDRYRLGGLVHCYAAASMCRAFCVEWVQRTPTKTKARLTCFTCIDYMAVTHV